MRFFNYQPQTIRYTQDPFPAFRYISGRPLLLLPLARGVRVDVEAQTIVSRVRLEPQRNDRGYVAVPARKRRPGTVIMDRLGGDAEVIRGEERIFAGKFTERDGRTTEVVFAALLERGDTLRINGSRR